MKGKIIVFTGDGKGKTTAALGCALRAIGYGKKVIMIQFLKKGEYGEIKAAIEGLRIMQFGKREFITKAEEEDKEMAKKGLKAAKEALKEKPFILILDEINVAMAMDVLEIKEVLEVLKERGESHVILTGRNAPKEIIEMADLVTEMKKIKHYYDEGIKAIEGLEY